MIKKLLQQLKECNEADKEHGEQYIFAPEPIKPIRMLDGKTTRELSPMLLARFTFCSRWNNAYLSQDWFSLNDIENIKNNTDLIEQIVLRYENCRGMPPSSVNPDRCAVLGANLLEGTEIYLVWLEDEIEPEIWEYFGWDYYQFKHFENYLNYILGNKTHDDSGRDI